MRNLLWVLAVLGVNAGEVREHPGGKELPHEKYVRVVSEEASPVLPVYIKSKDGL